MPPMPRRSRTSYRPRRIPKTSTMMIYCLTASSTEHHYNSNQPQLYLSRSGAVHFRPMNPLNPTLLPPLIALLTDFGTIDPYVGVMKGVIASHCPAAQVIDITHEICPQNTRQGAYLLRSAYRHFP